MKMSESITTAQLSSVSFSQEANQSSMMDLEIADYERTVQALNNKITERDAAITDLKSEVERLEEKAKALKEQIGKNGSVNKLDR